MDTDVQNIVASCGLCKQATMKPDQYPRLPTGVPQKPFDKLAIDLVVPLRKSYMGNVYILTMIDLCIWDGLKLWEYLIRKLKL